jgi:uncharacterized membrane protein
MLVHLLATEATTVHTGIAGQAEYLLREFAFFLKIILEFIAIVIVAIALVKTLQKFFYYQRRHQPWMFQSSVRLELGISLALSLEFLLAADIVGTAISPGWQEIAQLAAITGIRTFLNFFLHREVQELQELSSAHSPLRAVELEEFDS